MESREWVEYSGSMEWGSVCTWVAEDAGGHRLERNQLRLGHDGVWIELELDWRLPVAAKGAG